jgi:hypothetical protein
VQVLVAIAGVRNGTRRESEAQDEREGLGAHFEGWLLVNGNERLPTSWIRRRRIKLTNVV